MPFELTDKELTQCLKDWRMGDLKARDQLFEALYSELKIVAAGIVRREGRVSLSSEDLLNEASARLVTVENVDWQDKAHFMALAARTMRRVLIDYIRKKDSDKRQHHKDTLMTGVMGAGAQAFELASLEQALIRLHAIDATRAEIVEMRFFGGLSIEDISAVTGLSSSTVKRNWRSSKAWLLQAIEEDLSNRL